MLKNIAEANLYKSIEAEPKSFTEQELNQHDFLNL
jgi:hypothetical protein